MIELRDIQKTFDGHVVLRDYSYQFCEGKSYALIGESGAGKTTLLNIIGKLETAQNESQIEEKKGFFKRLFGG